MSKKASIKAGRPIGDHAQRQRDIADILLKTIGEYGFEKASLRTVALEAGCTTGVLSHYFSSKEDLICHAVDLLFDWVEQRTVVALHNPDSIVALEIAVCGTGDDPSFDFWAVWLQVLAGAKQNRRLAQIVSRRHGRYRELLTQIVEAGQARGQIRDDMPADLLADQINAVSDGMGMMAPIETKRLSAERVRQIMEISLDFLRPAGVNRRAKQQ